MNGLRRGVPDAIINWRMWGIQPSNSRKSVASSVCRSWGCFDERSRRIKAAVPAGGWGGREASVAVCRRLSTGGRRLEWAKCGAGYRLPFRQEVGLSRRESVGVRIHRVAEAKELDPYREVQDITGRPLSTPSKSLHPWWCQRTANSRT